MPHRDDDNSKVAVKLLAIVALVVVSFIDVGSKEAVSPLVYGGLGGGLVGVDTLKRLLK